MDILIDEIISMLEKNQGLALATIISHNGSAPRRAGAQMIVHTDGSIVGTVGGGLMESMVIKSARKAIENKDCSVIRIEMTGETAATGDMICGGIQEVLVEYLNPADKRLFAVLSSYQALVHQRRQGWWITRIPSGSCAAADHFLVQDDGTLLTGEMDAAEAEVGLIKQQENPENPSVLHLNIAKKTMDLEDIHTPTLITIQNDRWLIDPILFYGTVYLFGAGHVSQQLAKVTKLVWFRTIVIDDREEFANRQRFPEVDEVVVVPDYHHIFDQIRLDPESYMIIVTRGHLFDRYVLAQCLKSSAVYIGMIGSKRKIQLVYEQLEQEGFTREQLDKVYSPIGLKIGAETPEEIAVSITAELIQCRNDRKKAG